MFGLANFKNESVYERFRQYGIDVRLVAWFVNVASRRLGRPDRT